ncbi:MAG: DUF5683 domain-containing protein [Tannerella sp.]|jgi:hypothetical protein|nr:DUF5683 domain-containing protein [Tannerella sp.]
MNINQCFRHISKVIFTGYLLLNGMVGQGLYAQDTINKPVIDTIENEAIKLKLDSATFKPNPKTAYMIAAVFPGTGQIYNRQYWKLPIVYGGLAGFVYAITWNNKNYQDYQKAYFDIVADIEKDPTASNPDSWSQSWQDFIPGNVDPATYFNNSSFQNNLKSGKDFYRRNRDLSIILSVAFYLICVADAYVDAQMFDFDVSPDLSFRVTPQIQNSLYGNSKNFGFNICMNF